jgi:UDP-N-acetylglucosamine--N-acetylmuramyl-(pentapeptide) pyrophosphoryl-undecaprenol N-acetylglucosamine transferase
MRILAVAGSSGGHIYPAVSFLSAVKNKDRSADTLLVLPQRSTAKNIIPGISGIKYICTTQLSLRPSPGNLISWFKYLKGAVQSFELIVKFKPDIVVGFGSIDSIPLVMLAWLFRIKTLIHEQNAIPGKANRFLAKFADKIAVTFPQSENYFQVNASKITATGNPIRNDLMRIDRIRALDFFGLKERFTVLVMGGSQGSKRINKFFSEAAKRIILESDFQVIHICGNDSVDEIVDAYRQAGIAANVTAYLQQMQYAYSAADLVVCRAGATTISELSYFALPAIIIPYPYAYAHQVENARI